MINSDINDKFNNWLSYKKDYESILKIHPRDLNQRFYSLKKPFNTHCKINYVDFNCVVDQILQMSLPYCDAKNNNNNNNNNIHINNINNVSMSVINCNLKNPNKTSDNTSVYTLDGQENNCMNQLRDENQHVNKGK